MKWTLEDVTVEELWPDGKPNVGDEAWRLLQHREPVTEAVDVYELYRTTFVAFAEGGLRLGNWVQVVYGVGACGGIEAEVERFKLLEAQAAAEAPRCSGEWPYAHGADEVCAKCK